ncbi:MAG: endopeptidase [Solirubrobacteraceae bacterium]|nr:endopeptidase [Solirubrobacteraceae bacterium]
MVVAAVVAEVAVVLLRPRDGVIEPAPVQVQSYFSPSEIERARDFRRPQLALLGGALAVELGLLAVLVARPPRRLRGPFRRPLLAAAATGATLSVAVATVALPFNVVAHQRARDVGLVTQSWGGYAGDQAKSWTIGAIIAGAGAAAALALIRRFPRRWWVPGSVVVVAFGAITIYAGPVVLDPLFNTFTALKGRSRADVLDLARRAGVDVGQVYEVDASRRTTAANAYVTGLGHTKRVVLYDTLLEHFTRDETRLVVAHELGHVRYSDVSRGLLFVVIVTPFGMLAAALLTRRLAPDGTGARPGPAILPALALSLAITSALVTIASNQLSRRVEVRADSFALGLAHEPDAFISFERRIAVRNLADPDPPGWLTFLLGTHPPTIERIGVGEAYKRGARSPTLRASVRPGD